MTRDKLIRRERERRNAKRARREAEQSGPNTDITQQKIDMVRELRDLGWLDMSIVVTLKKMGWPASKAMDLIDASYNPREN